MPINGVGWEIEFTRTAVQTQPTTGRLRTIGTYQIFHDGLAQPGTDMSGMFAERPGPGDNSKVGKKNGLRIAAGRYPLATQAGTKYVTIGYANSNMINVLPRPGVELLNTDKRSEILIHPGIGFLSSIGCINLCASLPNGAEGITYTSSRRRVISMIDDMKSYIGAAFPNANGRSVSNAHAILDGEP